ncbi:SUMF1/EgtB/PvdO family nonheme iron enzyme [Methylolobus aquaticus]
MQRTPTPGVCAQPSFAGDYSIPRGSLTTRLRVVRGGSWNNKPENVRATNRNRNDTGNTNNNNGFRLASTPHRPEPPRSRRWRARTGRPRVVMSTPEPRPRWLSRPRAVTRSGFGQRFLRTGKEGS